MSANHEQSVPHVPAAATSHNDVTKLIERRRSPQEAWADGPYIESDPPHAYASILFDVDDPDRWEYEVAGSVPNWQV